MSVTKRYSMQVLNKNEAPELSREDGLVSHILHSERDVESTDLTVTWVDVEPGSKQVVHEHGPEQVYIIISGEGMMHVGGEEREVREGDLIHIPSNTEHGIRNTSQETLEYISAATPAFPMDEVDDFYDE